MRNLNVEISDPCSEKKDFCVNCTSHFMSVRPSINAVVVSKRFLRDLKDQDEASSIIETILSCSHLEFHELHKFERNIDGNLVFRARKGKVHIVYAVDKSMRILFLRAIRNYAQYKRFLESKSEILRLIARTRNKR